MIEALITSPASYFLAVLVAFSQALPRLGKRAWLMGPMALAGLAMYIVSTGIITSYHRVTGDIQVTWWTSSLLAVGLIYLAILTFRRVSPVIVGGLAAWVILAFSGAMAVENDLLRRMFWVFQYAGIGTLAFVSFLSVKKEDLLGLLVWGVLFIAEWIGVAQVVDCQLLHGLASQPIVEGSACAQVYNWAGAAYLPTVLPTLVLAYLVWRWFTPRKT